DRLRLGRREVTLRDGHGRCLDAVLRPHRGARSGCDRAHEREVSLLAPDPGVDARGDEAGGGRHAHTSTPWSRSPAVEPSPSARFAFCTACPAAPLPRLSSAQTTIVVPVASSVKTPSSAASVPCTRASSGTTPSGSIRTTSLPA